MPEILVELGNASHKEVRWWDALLAPRRGWIAKTAQIDRDRSSAPWSMTLDPEASFRLDWLAKAHTRDVDLNVQPPPSSSLAISYLARFCTQHGIHSQMAASFAAALTIPYQSLGVDGDGPIHLPVPTDARIRPNLIFSSAFAGKIQLIEQDLLYYLTLSCNRSVMGCIMDSILYGPSIPCSMAGLWTQPLLRELPDAPDLQELPGAISLRELPFSRVWASGLPPHYQEVLTVMTSLRRPRLSALCFGLAIVGKIPRLLHGFEFVPPIVNALGSLWTGCQQSFLDDPGSGSYFHKGDKLRISRSDVWRLSRLSDPDRRGSPGDCHGGFYPPGWSRTADIPVHARKHVLCERHTLDFISLK